MPTKVTIHKTQNAPTPKAFSHFGADPLVKGQTPGAADEVNETVPTGLEPNSGVPEIDVAETAVGDTEGDLFDRLLDECEKVSAERSVFDGADAHIHKALCKSFPVYQIVSKDPSAHSRLIDRLNHRHSNRQRDFSPKKPGYNSVVYGTNPATPEQWSACSEWAKVLLWADSATINDENFGTWVVDKTIRGAKKFLGSLDTEKVKVKKAKLKVPFFEADYPILTEAFAIKDGEAWKKILKAEFDNMQAALATSLKEREA